MEAQYPSIQSLVPDRFSQAIQQIPEELLNQTEDFVVEKAYGSWGNIPELDVDLRRNFWQLYNVAILTEDSIPAGKLYTGICSMNYFYTLLKEPGRVAFLITEPAKDKVKAKHLLFLSWPRMRKILMMDPAINSKTGQPDMKLMSLQFELFRYLDERENGMAIQKHQYDINQKNLNVNVSAEQAKELTGGLSPKETEEKLQALRQKREALMSGERQEPEILDVISHQEREFSITGPSVTKNKKEGV